MSDKITASVETIAQFYDVDAMKVVWHGNYVRFMEMGRAALLKKIGYSYYEMEKSGFEWPVVEMKFKYIKSIRLLQKIRIEATLDEYEFGMRISYKIFDSETGELLNKAMSNQMAVDVQKQESLIVSPRCFTDKVKEYFEAQAESSCEK